MTFAAKLKNLRLRKGQSLQELAHEIKISKAHLWDLETGKSRNPSADLLKKLSDHFGISVASLIGEALGEDTDEELAVMFRQFQESDPQTRELIRTIIETRKRQKEKEEKGDAD